MAVINSYETVFVASMNLGEEGIAALIAKFKDLIAENGTLESVDEWGKRRLAYPIMKQPEGYYTLINFKSTPEFTAELDRIYNITDGVLRSMIVKKEERKAKPQKAKKTPVEAEAASEAAAEPAVEAAE